MKTIIAVASILVAFVASSCKTGTETQANDCGTSQRVSLYKTIHSTGDFFELQTPDARNDCEATFLFYFRWADAGKRAIDNDMPPLDNIAEAFRPAGEFAYFPHPNPAYNANTEFVDSNGQSTGKGWWAIAFTIGNKNSGYPSTNYSVEVRLDPAKASSIDSTEITSAITYYPIK